METVFLILSGEGNIETEHQFCAEFKDIDRCNEFYDNLKENEFKETCLYIYEAKLIRES